MPICISCEREYFDPAPKVCKECGGIIVTHKEVSLETRAFAPVEEPDWKPPEGVKVLIVPRDTLL